MFDRDALVCTMLRLIVPDRDTPTRPVETNVRRESKARLRTGTASPLRLVTDEPEPRGQAARPPTPRERKGHPRVIDDR